VIRRRRGIAAGVWALVVVLLVSGCGGDDPDAALTAPPPAAGFTRVIGTGFTIDMPAGWQQPPLDPAAFDRTASQLRANNPKLAQALDMARRTLGSGSRLFAIDPVDGSSVNLIVVDANGRELDEVVEEATKQLQQVGVGSLRSEETRLGQRRATRLEFTLPVTGTSGSVAVPETQYYVMRDKRLFILTLFGGSPDLGTVAESLRIT
jgi:hypothetical protein